MSNDMVTYEAFEAAARAEGFDEVLVREWSPGQVLETHSHPFAVKALVVRGNFWLTEAERYGEQGATFWAARRHAG
jgi:quercetin dioxygenase-like cupin family protein